MLPEASPLYMLRVPVDQRRLFELGRRRGLPTRDVDLGYLVHCQLGELFGDLAPAPFAITGRPGREVTVLAYSGRPKAKLQEHADAFAEPGVHAACDFQRLDEKPMPTRWSVGKRLDFEVRVCPVVRVGSEDPRHRKGAEVDVFLARCRTAASDAIDTSIDREKVYREWLQREVERHGAVRLLAARLTSFQLDRVVRRRGDVSRTARTFERPAVVVRGQLEVADGNAFCALLRRGLGRHRAFGFGMLLLRPPGSVRC